MSCILYSLHYEYKKINTGKNSPGKSDINIDLNIKLKKKLYDAIQVTKMLFNEYFFTAFSKILIFRIA